MTKKLTSINRRKFLTGVLAAGATGLASSASFPTPAIASGKRQWNMVMTYQKELPGLGKGALRLAKRITALSDGALTIKAYGGGELVPPLGVFDAVSQGTAQMGFSAPYYWQSKSRSAAFFCTVPGGLTASEQNAWIYYGEGLKLWHELYAQFNLTAFPAGQTGTQMGGWYKRAINTVDDIKGLKMRIPGLAGEVIARLGGTPENIPSQDLFTAMQSGRIDALEWVGPWNDLALGFHKVSDYYYGPGFHEGGPVLELMINKTEYDALPKHLQQIIKIACTTENTLMYAEYLANNQKAMRELKEKHKVDVRTFPDPVLKAFFDTAEEVVAGTAEDSSIGKRIFESYDGFRRRCIEDGEVTEYGFMRGRNQR